MVKESRLCIRCDSRARELLDKAASYSHLGVSEFVLTHALGSAEKVVESAESMRLKPADFRGFLDALERHAKRVAT